MEYNSILFIARQIVSVMETELRLYYNFTKIDTENKFDKKRDGR